MRKWALLLSILLFGLPTLANDIYVGPSAAGAANGADCADARSYPWVNSAANWGTLATQIGPGTTVHLCSGTYTAPAGGNILVAQGSGTSSAPITFKFESGAVMQAPYFSASNGAISTNGASYLVLDGGSNGTIENMSNGSPGASCLSGSCSYQQATIGIFAAPCNGCEIKNLTIANMYVHSQCEASSGCDTALTDFGSATAIDFSGQNVSIHDNVIHDTGATFSNLRQGPTDSYNIYNNDMYHMDHGLWGGAPSGATTYTIKFHDNHVHDQMTWDTGTADKYHHDGVHLWSGGSGVLPFAYIYNNLFDGNEGQCCITAWVFLQTNLGTAQIYNNVFVQTLASGVPNGSISLGGGGISNTGTVSIFNNTFLSYVTSGGGSPAIFVNLGSGGSMALTVQNNAFSGMTGYIDVASSGVASLNADNNVYANVFPGGNPYWQWYPNATQNFASWQSACSCDAHSVNAITSSLGTLTEGVPQSGSIVLGVGLNLMNLATSVLSPLSSDTSAGNTRIPTARPTLGSWDAGAYEYSGLLSSAPAAPTNLSAVVQ